MPFSVCCHFLVTFLYVHVKYRFYIFLALKWWWKHISQPTFVQFSRTSMCIITWYLSVWVFVSTSVHYIYFAVEFVWKPEIWQNITIWLLSFKFNQFNSLFHPSPRKLNKLNMNLNNWTSNWIFTQLNREKKNDRSVFESLKFRHTGETETSKRKHCCKQLTE